MKNTDLLPKIKILITLSILFLSGCAAIEGHSNLFTARYTTNGEPGRIKVSEARDVCWLTINDPISPDAVRAFVFALANLDSRPCAERWIVLNSPGGSVGAAIEIGRMIRERKLNTSLMSDGTCSSACSLIFIGGVRREANRGIFSGGKIGFHQLSRRYADGSRECIDANMPQYKILSRYAETMLAPDGASRFISLIASTDCKRLTYRTLDSLIESGIITGVGGSGIRLF